MSHIVNLPAGVTRVVIDGPEAFGVTDAEQTSARLYCAKRDGKSARGTLSDGSIIDWRNAGEPVLESEAGANAARKLTEVRATVHAYKLTSKGQRSKVETTFEVTRGAVAAVRQGLKGAPTVHNYVAAVSDALGDEFVPFRVVLDSGKTFDATFAVDSHEPEWSTKDSSGEIKDATIAELRKQLEALQAAQADAEA